MSCDAASAQRWAIWLETVSLVGVYVTGTILTVSVAWPFGLLYVAYALLANLLFMGLICPYCCHCRAGTCPSGYHHIAMRFKKKEGRNFADQFKRYVGVMYPIWFAPPVAGAYLLVGCPSWMVAVWLGAFCLFGFVLVPYASRRICGRCLNAECPRRKKADVRVP